MIENLKELVEDRPKEWRKGQAYFNYLRQEWPIVAEEIRGTDKNPFHNDEAIPKLINHLKELYED